jgi:hypothetical protein
MAKQHILAALVLLPAFATSDAARLLQQQVGAPRRARAPLCPTAAARSSLTPHPT